MYSRVRASGFANGIPYQPSTTCGPETPIPRITRPPDRWSSVIAAIAAAAGWRADICMIPVPSRTFSVRAPHQASGVRQSEPYASAAQIESSPRRLGLGDRLDDAGRRARGPVPGVVAELQPLAHPGRSLFLRRDRRLRQPRPRRRPRRGRARDRHRAADPVRVSSPTATRRGSLGDRVEEAISEHADAELEIERGEAESARSAPSLRRTVFWLAVTGSRSTWSPRACSTCSGRGATCDAST